MKKTIYRIFILIILLFCIPYAISGYPNLFHRIIFMSSVFTFTLLILEIVGIDTVGESKRDVNIMKFVVIAFMIGTVLLYFYKI